MSLASQPSDNLQSFATRKLTGVQCCEPIQLGWVGLGSPFRSEHPEPSWLRLSNSVSEVVSLYGQQQTFLFNEPSVSKVTNPYPREKLVRRSRTTRASVTLPNSSKIFLISSSLSSHLRLEQYNRYSASTTSSPISTSLPHPSPPRTATQTPQRLKMRNCSLNGVPRRIRTLSSCEEQENGGKRRNDRANSRHWGSGPS